MKLNQEEKDMLEGKYGKAAQKSMGKNQWRFLLLLEKFLKRKT